MGPWPHDRRRDRKQKTIALTDSPSFRKRPGDATVADKFDPYREALIVETSTCWPEEYDELEPTEKARLEALLHADPEHCTALEYVRMHTGFCRQVTVTSDDYERVAS